MLTNPWQLDSPPANVGRMPTPGPTTSCSSPHRSDHSRSSPTQGSSLKSFDEPELLSVDGNIIYLHVDIDWKRPRIFLMRMISGGW